jgi:hypothetical protein
MADQARVGCILWTKCEPCQWDSHYDQPTEHTWMGDDDLDHARNTGQTIPDPLPHCGCWCTGRWPGTGDPVSADEFNRMYTESILG